MKRNNELIRALMLKLEAIEIRPSDIIHIMPDAEEIAVEGYSTDEIEYHMNQIDAIGFMTEIGGGRPMEGWAFRSLTPAGHDFIDTVRDPQIWRKTKEGASKIGGGGISLLVEIAKAAAKAELQKLGVLP